jgi:predicted NBD/HSP70 family sugar kinase
MNRLRVLDALRRSGTASRSDLARITGLSRTTVASLVAGLSSAGIVVEDAPPGPTGRGRPSGVLRLDLAVGVVVGIHFDHRRLRVGVADLASTVLAERDVPLDVDHEADEALDAAVELVEAVLEEAGVDRAKVVGVGAALSAPVQRDGTVGNPRILPSWIGINAREELSRRLGLEANVDNDANLGALAELTFGAGRGLTDAVYVKLSTGIGAGLVLDGRIYRGSTGIAGELGHVQVQPDGPVCACGGRGCLQTVAAIPALLALAREVHGHDLTAQGLFEHVHAGDFGARRIVGEAGRAVGRVLADLCNLVNPQAIIVGGDLSAAGEPLLAGIRESIERRALPDAAKAVEVKAAVLGDRAQVLGALALVIGDTERLRSAGLAALSVG